MRRLQFALAVLCTSGLAAGASAGDPVVSIGEFTGDLFEGFEAISAPAPWPGPMPIFGGMATFDDEFTDPWIATSLSGGDSTLFPYDGNLMGLIPVGWTRFVFDTPISQFGGFIGTVQQGVDGRARFYDVEGALIAAIDFSTPAGEWTWHGWQSSVPIARVEIDTGVNPGTTTVFDNLQASFEPDKPACLADLTGSGEVGVADLLALLAEWGPCPAPCPADLTSDGDVGVSDLLALLAAWGPCS